MTSTAALDGRLARSQRTRLAIVEALRALHHDGDLRPTAPRVAERAGVSVRTVWQHFEDLESLLVEAGRRDLEIALDYVDAIDPDDPLEARIDALVRQRSQMYEGMAPPWRAARLMEPFSAQIRTNRDRLNELGRRQIVEAFGPELARARDPSLMCDAVQVATSWAGWESLRTEMRLDVPAAMAVVTTTLTALLRSASPD